MISVRPFRLRSADIMPRPSVHQTPSGPHFWRTISRFIRTRARTRRMIIGDNNDANAISFDVAPVPKIWCFGNNALNDRLSGYGISQSWPAIRSFVRETAGPGRHLRRLHSCITRTIQSRHRRNVWHAKTLTFIFVMRSFNVCRGKCRNELLLGRKYPRTTGTAEGAALTSELSLHFELYGGALPFDLADANGQDEGPECC